MKESLAIAGIIVIALILGFGVGNAVNQPEPLPEPMYIDTLVFHTPCDSHGQHMNTIVDSRMEYVYLIESDDGNFFTVLESDLEAMLIMLGQN
jgi:hypothetical protein